MSTEQKNLRLSRILTWWTMVFEAHREQGNEAATIHRHRLLLRYYRPVYHYLRAMVRDADVAEELTHEFVVHFLRGDFKRADPSCGRFRDLIKRALRHLAIDYWRRTRVDKEKTPFHLPDDRQGTPADPNGRHRLRPKQPSEPELDTTEADRAFLRGCRSDMLAQAWRLLERFEEQSGCGYATVLRLRGAHPDANSAELAELVGEQLGKTFSEAAFRQLLRRARDKLADCVVAVVRRSLGTHDPDVVEADLIELHLHSYCKQALLRLRQSRNRGRNEPPGRPKRPKRP
jgi:RNA polymerase sigma-70 factor (ECF subfamily)